MLTNTFCHIPGIGLRLESRIWSRGFRSWACVLEKPSCELPRRFGTHLLPHLRRSVEQLDRGNAAFFADRLPPAECWRMFPEFRQHAAYVDIETTGLRPGFSTITTIVLFDGRKIRHYVCGRNLEDFLEDVAEYKLLITYNGRCFDVPFIEKQFDVRIEAAQIDLRYVLGSLGYKGGLKGCERQLGICRGDLDGLDGYFAVLLWEDYMENGNELALETLLAYNVEDVVNLERLMVAAYNMKIKPTPFAGANQFAEPAVPPIPFKADRETIERIRRHYLSW
jgi:uncharacterized protein YprB with RNaseH-like and TPR domain